MGKVWWITNITNGSTYLTWYTIAMLIMGTAVP